MPFKSKESAKKWRIENREHWNIMQKGWSKKRREKLRLEIIKLLGGQCANPYGLHNESFTDFRCLQVDHINRKAKHREEFGTTGSEMYLRFVIQQLKAGSKDYQLLCANCNWIKRYENKEYGKP